VPDRNAKGSQPRGLARLQDKPVIFPFKDIFKKVKKKLVSPWDLPLNGNLGATNRPRHRSKIFLKK